MASIWQLTGPSIPSDDFASEHVDTIVAGAGLTGLAVGVLLARAGQRVTVLEARTVGAVTTGNTTAKLSLLQGSTYSDIREHAGDEVLRAYGEANREGSAWLLRELDTKGIDVPRAASFAYANGASGMATLEQELEACEVIGLPAEMVSRVDLPFKTVGALRLEAQGLLHPIMVLAALAAEFRDRGGKIVEHCRVQGARASGGEVEIETSRGGVTASRLVLATGTPVLDRGMFFAKLEPSRSFAAAYRLGAHRALADMYVSVDSPSRSLRMAEDVNGDELLVVGGDAFTTGRADDTFAVVRELDDWVARSFGECERVAWWGAQDYRTHSRVPFAGRIPGGDDRIYAATGYNKWGMSNAIASALSIAADMLGGNLEWARVLRDHSVSAADVVSAVQANASVAGNLVSDWAKVEFTAPRSVESLAEGQGVMVRDGLKPVAVSRVDGATCRVSGVCTHMGGVLRWNGVEQSWDCPLHGSRFDARGQLLEGPAVHDLEGVDGGNPSEGAPEPPRQ